MEEALKDLLRVAIVPFAIYAYHRYMKMTAKDSPGGEVVTWDELVDTVSDPEFWNYALEVTADKE